MKKVLSFVLVLSLVLSSFSMAFAGVGEKEVGNLTDIAGTANEEAITIVNDLGIVTGYTDGTFKADKSVNRAEFAVMITKALGIPESALTGYTATNFTDVAGYEWAVPYLAFCESKGIMSGYGNGIVKPGNTITVNEAMAMALRAVGYTPNSAELVGTWPSNYVTKAQDLDLYEDVKASNIVDRGSAAQIIYNSLTVTKVAVDADGATNPVTNKADNTEVNMLNSGLNCDSPAGYELVTSAMYEDALIDVTSYLGAYGNAYYNEDDELVAFDKVDCTTLVGEMDEDEFAVGDKNYSFKNGITIGAIIWNSDSVADVSGAAVTVGAVANEASMDLLEEYSDVDLIINADVTGKTIHKIHSVVVWTLSGADLAEDDVQEDIEDNELLGKEFAEDNNGDIDMAQFRLLGVNSLTDIEEDDVVYVACDNGGRGDIRMVVVGQKTVEGKITKADDEDLYINGEWYGAADAAYTANGNTANKNDIGDEYKLYLDGFGDYFYAEKTTGSVGTFGVIKGQDPAGVDNTKVKLYTSMDSTKTYAFADDDDDIDYLIDGRDAVLNGSNVSSSAVSIALTTAISDGKLVGYELDANGDIDTLEVPGTTVTTAKLKSTKIMTVNGTDYDVIPEVVVFTYDGSNDGTDDYEIIKISEVETNVSLTTGAGVQVVFNDDDEVIAFMMMDDASTTDKDTDEVYGVFHSRYDSENEDEDKNESYEGFIDGKEGEFATDDTRYNRTVTTIGELYIIELAEDGTIDTIDSLYGLDAQKDTRSGYITLGALVTDVADKGTVITITSGGVESKFTIADDAIVYEAVLDGTDLDYYELSKLSNIAEGYTVYLYDTEGDDCDMIADVVIFVED